MSVDDLVDVRVARGRTSGRGHPQSRGVRQERGQIALGEVPIDTPARPRRG